jgi:Uncharacterized conserved protein
VDEKLFLADAMLGKLARWIRICGFDTCYADSTMSDTDILDKVEKSGRILITRDRELSMRSACSFLIRSDISDDQLLEFFRNILRSLQNFLQDALSATASLIRSNRHMTIWLYRKVSLNADLRYMFAGIAIKSTGMEPIEKVLKIN